MTLVIDVRLGTIRLTVSPLSPTEASRAIRKKLKYGNVHRQIRALTVSSDLGVTNAYITDVECPDLEGTC